MRAGRARRLAAPAVRLRESKQPSGMADQKKKRRSGLRNCFALLDFHLASLVEIRGELRSSCLRVECACEGSEIPMTPSCLAPERGPKCGETRISESRV